MTTIRDAFDGNYRETMRRQKPYPCPYCGKEYSSSATKIYHVHIMHEKEIKRY